jgi:hypothetical protein
MTLTEYRIRSGINLKKLAELSDCSYTFLKEIARGAKKPSLELALKIEKATDGLVGHENWYQSLEDAGMSIDQAAINFFQAIFRLGAQIFGHPRFIFRVEVTIGSGQEDSENAKILNKVIQDSLTLANESIRPLMRDEQLTHGSLISMSIEETSLQ